MACNLANEFLCNSINSFRVAEDSITTVLLITIMTGLIYTAHKTVKEGPLIKRLWAIVIGLTPFLAWKAIGTIRRIFLENPPFIFSYEFGEIFEGLAGLGILLSLIYLYLLIRTKK